MLHWAVMANMTTANIKALTNALSLKSILYILFVVRSCWSYTLSFSPKKQFSCPNSKHSLRPSRYSNRLHAINNKNENQTPILKWERNEIASKCCNNCAPEITIKKHTSIGTRKLLKQLTILLFCCFVLFYFFGYLIYSLSSACCWCGVNFVLNSYSYLMFNNWLYIRTSRLLL